MAKFVFVSLPLHSHANPTFPIVRELVARGDEVIYYLTDQFQAKVEATGATFRRYESKIEHISKTATTAGKPVGLPIYMVDESLFVLPQILESIREEQPACLVYETMCLSGRLAAEILHIPAVNFRTMFAFNQQLAQLFRENALQDATGIAAFQAAMAKACEVYHVRPFHVGSIFTHEEALNIVALPRAFQIDGDAFGEQFCFIGPAMDARNETVEFPFARLAGQPVLYISRGTIYNDRADFFNLCFAAFADLPWTVVMSIGQNVDPQKLATAPDNFIVRPYVPQLEILKHATVCVTHGGMMTTLEALAQGVPLVVVPQSTGDVIVNARRVAQLGLGTILDEKMLTAESLREAVLRVSNDPEYYTRTRHMQEEIKNAGGSGRAADVLQNFVKVSI